VARANTIPAIPVMNFILASNLKRLGEILLMYNSSQLFEPAESAPWSKVMEHLQAALAFTDEPGGFGTQGQN
jgi:hypothetical protein